MYIAGAFGNDASNHPIHDVPALGFPKFVFFAEPIRGWRFNPDDLRHTLIKNSLRDVQIVGVHVLLEARVLGAQWALVGAPLVLGHVVERDHQEDHVGADVLEERWSEVIENRI